MALFVTLINQNVLHFAHFVKEGEKSGNIIYWCGEILFVSVGRVLSSLGQYLPSASGLYASTIY
jgi:hypothetical protein